MLMQRFLLSERDAICCWHILLLHIFLRLKSCLMRLVFEEYCLLILCVFRLFPVFQVCRTLMQFYAICLHLSRKKLKVTRRRLVDCRNKITKSQEQDCIPSLIKRINSSLKSIQMSLTRNEALHQSISISRSILNLQKRINCTSPVMEVVAKRICIQQFFPSKLRVRFYRTRNAIKTFCFQFIRRMVHRFGNCSVVLTTKHFWSCTLNLKPGVWLTAIFRTRFSRQLDFSENINVQLIQDADASPILLKILDENKLTDTLPYLFFLRQLETLVDGLHITAWKSCFGTFFSSIQNDPPWNKYAASITYEVLRVYVSFLLNLWLISLCFRRRSTTIRTAMKQR